jgi:AhpD family alkylhydroperoxidase
VTKVIGAVNDLNCDPGSGRRPEKKKEMTDTMNTNWLGITTEMSAAVKELRTGMPNVMKGFSALARAVAEPKALEIKTKELICPAISVATRCDPCIAFHAQSAVKQGATRDEVMETMGMAVYMGAGPSVMYAAQEVEARTTEVLKQKGFGIITEIDVREAFQKTLGIEFCNYRILGACNPALAPEALELEDKVGTMLPCSVVVQEMPGGAIHWWPKPIAPN